MQFDGKKPLYIQLYEYYVHLLEKGAFEEGDMLPSVREVAHAFAINPVTVLKAYEALAEEGYIYSVYKKGYFVKKGGKGTALKEEIRHLLSLGYSLEDIEKAVEEMKGERK